MITGTVISLQNASSVRECATIAANTEGRVSWTYRKSKGFGCYCNCIVKNLGNGASESDSAEKISGEKECGEMSQEEWDQMNFESCDIKYDRGVQGNSAGEDNENIESPQACAQLAVNRPRASFWVYNKKSKMCFLKKNYTTEYENVYSGDSGRVMGNVACGLMSQEHWTPVIDKSLDLEKSREEMTQ